MMMIARLALLTVLVTSVAFTQAPVAPAEPAATAPPPATEGAVTPTPDSAAPAAPAPVEMAPPPAPVPEPPRGDTITLKSGQVIAGLQIIKATSTDYICEIIEGVTLNVPRRQVVKVEPDDYDPILMRRKSESALIRGQRISDALQRKLDTDISNPPLNYENADLLQIIEEVNKRTGGVVVLDLSVSTLPAESRTGSIASQPGMTLGTLLRKEILIKFPNLVMNFEDDKVVLTTKPAAPPADASSATPPAGAPPDAGAPPAAPPPPGPPPAPAPAPGTPATIP
ncbi:MAG: hypothetical protein IT365_08330 [Candidatus Hydrogenedentes bacterium]|nr:hypothetical protein [Candidatus Hydrogenedentota bacterium]